jgi:hypothetical protein
MHYVHVPSIAHVPGNPTHKCIVPAPLILSVKKAFSAQPVASLGFADRSCTRRLWLLVVSESFPWSPRYLVNAPERTMQKEDGRERTGSKSSSEGVDAIEDDDACSHPQSLAFAIFSESFHLISYPSTQFIIPNSINSSSSFHKCLFHFTTRVRHTGSVKRSHWLSCNKELAFPLGKRTGIYVPTGAGHFFPKRGIMIGFADAIEVVGRVRGALLGVGGDGMVRGKSRG